MKNTFLFAAIACAGMFAFSVLTQAQNVDAPSSIMRPPEAFARMSPEQVRETEAYTLGVQAVLWGMQWVKANEMFRMMSRPLPAGQARSPFDNNPHGINIWGHAQSYSMRTSAPSRRRIRRRSIPRRCLT